jgi:uncharacterized protein (DUF2336 family)
MDDALSGRSGQQRVKTLQRITDLFVTSAERLDEQSTALFDDVMGRLIEIIEIGARAELADRLAPIPNAPGNVIRRLARDDEILVAGPVLAKSQRLTEKDLVEIAETKSQAHLLAISGRPWLDQAVTDVLVNLGDTNVVKAVVGNPGARFSEGGLGMVVQRANRAEMIIDALVRRADIPPRVFGKLLARATETVRRRLLAEAPPRLRAESGKVAATPAENSVAHAGPIKPNYAAAIRRLVLEQRVSGLGEADVAKFAEAKLVEDTFAALSLISEVPIDAIERVIGSEDVEPALILCKAAEFHWTTARAIILLRPRNRPHVADDLIDAWSAYDRLAVPSAKKVVKFWQSQAVH